MLKATPTTPPVSLSLNHLPWQGEARIGAHQSLKQLIFICPAVGQNQVILRRKTSVFLWKNCIKNRLLWKIRSFCGKMPHFMGFPPKCPLFHSDFAPLKWKIGEVAPFRPQKVGKKGLNLSHFPRSFPLKNRRKPLILLGFRRFSTICSQVEMWAELYLIFGVKIAAGTCPNDPVDVFADTAKTVVNIGIAKAQNLQSHRL